MNNDEQMHSAEEYDYNPEQTDNAEEYDYNRDKIHGIEEYDYDREPPLDSATASSNRQNSKYVFMTLCFLLALMLLYTYITNANAGNSGDWFPLVGGIVLGIMGVIFLRSPNSPPETQLATANDTTTAISGSLQAQAKELSPFEELIQEALATIPDEFHEKMENVVVHVEYEPDQKTRTRVGLNEGYTLLGLYEGVPLTTYGRNYASYPELITIYQRSIEEYCHHDDTRIREQVRTTVLHEVAHHFGMGHEEMPIWVK